MDTNEALNSLGVSDVNLQREQRQQLDHLGYFIAKDALSADATATMAEAFERLYTAEVSGGDEVHVEPGARRISDIFNKTSEFDLCLTIKPVLAAAKYLLGEFKLHGANLRDPTTGGGHQQLHSDVPKKSLDDWWVLNAIILLDDVTSNSGATRVIPGSHLWCPLNVPVVNIGDWTPGELSEEDKARVPNDLDAPYPGEILATAPAGSAIIINSSLWHGGTLKNNDKPRRVLHLSYTRRDLPQQLPQLDYLTPELFNRMSPELRYLMEIEPLKNGDDVLRQPDCASEGWWN